MSYRFLMLAIQTGFQEWQIGMLSFLFAFVASGNLITTLITVFKKMRDSQRTATLKSPPKPKAENLKFE